MTTGFERRDLLRLGGLIAALLAVVAIVVVAGGGGGSSTPASGQMTGVLTEVSQTKLVLAPSDGGSPQEFTVRPQDQRQLDLFHLEQHAADSLPSIVHYESEGDTRFATRVDDAPTP